MSSKLKPAGVSSGVLASEMRNETAGSFAGLLGLSAVIGYVHFAFRPYADRLLLDLWTIATASVLGVWFGALVVVTQRRPSDDEMLGIWAPGGRVIISLTNLCIAASVWLLVPAAPEDLRVLMIVLYVGFVVLQLAVSTEATQVATPAVIGVLGSVVAVVALGGGRYSTPLALFLAMIGGMLLMVRRLIRANVIAATEARLASDEASARLRTALAAVAAERDARTRFIRAASHDLAQPLQAARLFFDRHLKSSDPAERDRAAAGVARAFASTAALLDSMLMHLKLDAGAVRSVPERIDVDEFLGQLSFDHGPAAAEAGVRLRAPLSNLAVDADPQLLRRALGNLVGNAIRHSKGENVLIAARRSGEGAVRFWVLDDGEGIDAALAPNLFEDFAQGEGSSAQGGFGLGLASVRKLAGTMGGEAGYDPGWRSGSAFWIELPRCRTNDRAMRVAA